MAWRHDGSKSFHLPGLSADSVALGLFTPRFCCSTGRDRPVNHAVANFLGSTNILQGKVVEAYDGLATGARWRCQYDRHAVSVSSLGASVDAIFRLAGVTIHRDPVDGAIGYSVERVVSFRETNRNTATPS